MLLIRTHAVQAFMVCFFAVKVSVAFNKVESVSVGMVDSVDVADVPASILSVSAGSVSVISVSADFNSVDSVCVISVLVGSVSIGGTLL